MKKEERFNKLIVYIVKEKDIVDLLRNDFLIEEETKTNLFNLIEINFNTFIEFLYTALKYYYLPTCKSENLIDKCSLSEKDFDKINEILKFVTVFDDVYVIDIFDYLYTLTNIDEMIFNANFYDFIGNYLIDKEINIDYIDEYFYILKKIFDIFLLNTIFNISLTEKNENIAFGINVYTNKNNTMILNKENSEMHIFVFNN